MVYQRKFKVKGQYIYYTLTRCKRDEYGNPRQEHIAYLGKNPLNEDELKHYKELERDLKPHEIKLTEIFHSIHKNKDGLIEYDTFVKKAKINGILKKFVDEYIELFADSKTLIKIQTNKNIKTNLSENILNKIDTTANKESFQKPTLEKVTRLYYIFKELNNSKIFRENFAIFGGTAINAIYQKWPRLSVDLDIQYIGKKTKDEMNDIREQVNKVLENTFVKLNYEMKETRKTGGTYSYKIKYTMRNKHEDDIKLDINFLNRVSILPLVKKKFHSPLGDESFETLTFQKEELYSRKFIALTERTASRDIYDISNLDSIDYNKFTKTLICNYLLNTIEPKKLESFKLKEKNLQDFEKQLRPTLRKNIKLDPKILIKKTEEIISKIQENINKEDLKFASNFDKNKPNFEKLFEKIEFNQDINKSPLLETIKK